MEERVQIEACHPLKAFCQEYIAKHREHWPTKEMELAAAFVEHFRLPVLAHVSALKVFTVRTKIELIECDIPPNLLGLNNKFQRDAPVL